MPEDVELIENHNNDGDSFRVRWRDKEFTVRIYFVDAPETDLSYRSRVRDQADYFGITLEQAVEAGRMASDLVLTKLVEEGFTITTRRQQVFTVTFRTASMALSPLVGGIWAGY